MYENYYDKFKEECFLRNRSAGTTEQYWSAIKTFMKWCNYKPMEELTIQDARNYILSKRKSGSKSETCNFYNSAIAFLLTHV